VCFAIDLLTVAAKSRHPFSDKDFADSSFATFFKVGYSEAFLNKLSSWLRISSGRLASLHIFLVIGAVLRVTLRALSSRRGIICGSLLGGDVLYFSFFGLFYYYLGSSIWIWWTFYSSRLTWFKASWLLASRSCSYLFRRVLRNGIVSILFPSFVAI